MPNTAAAAVIAADLDERCWPARGLAATELGQPLTRLGAEITILAAADDGRRDLRGRYRSRRSDVAFTLAG